MLEVARIRSRTSSDTFLSRFPPFFINLSHIEQEHHKGDPAGAYLTEGRYTYAT